MAKFFSKENIHTAGWTILIGVISFICGLLWKHFDGPDEVKIVSGNISKKDTTVTIIKFEPIQDSQEYDSSIMALQTKNEKSQNYHFNPALVDSLIKVSLTKQSRSSIKPYVSKVSSSAQISDSSAPLYRPKFTMPSIVTGYTDGQINSYATINVNKTVFTQNDYIELTTIFLQKDILNKITPLFVDIVKRTSPTSATQIWSDQFVPNDTKTKVKFSAAFNPDMYELTIGFYLKDNVDNKYPEFYSKKFAITIQ